MGTGTILCMVHGHRNSKRYNIAAGIGRDTRNRELVIQNRLAEAPN